MIRQNKQNLY